MSGRPTSTATRPDIPGGAGTSPVAASTLATTVDDTSPYAFAPTLSVSAGTPGGTWATVITRASDASSVSVTDSTTTTPTATLTAATPADGDAFACVSTYTDPDGLTDAVETTVRMAGTGGAGASWSDVESTDFTTTSTGALSGGTNTIDGLDWEADLNSGTITDDANGLRFISANSSFVFLQRDVQAVLADVGKPWRFTVAFDDFTIDDGANVGIGVYSSTDHSGTVRIPAVQLRCNRSGATYNVQGLHSTGAVGGNSSFTVAGNVALGGAPTSAVLEVYGWGTMLAMRWHNGTATIPVAASPEAVFADDTNYWITAAGTFGTAPGGALANWPDIWVSIILGAGGAVSAQADALDYQMEEYG